MTSAELRLLSTLYVGQPDPARAAKVGRWFGIPNTPLTDGRSSDTVNVHVRDFRDYYIKNLVWGHESLEAFYT